MTREPLCVHALADCEVPALIALARTVWYAHYPGIITPAQIEYMLQQRYRAEVVREELRRSDVWWELASVGADAVGFSSCILGTEPAQMKLDKLYVHPGWQRQGVGHQLLERACERARSLACARLVLAVNKRNASAIAAYRRWGFEVEQEMVKDIGNGFVMDDYLMVRAL